MSCLSKQKKNKLRKVSVMISNAPKALLYVHPRGGPDDTTPCLDTFTCFLFYQMQCSKAVNLLCHGIAVRYTLSNQEKHRSTCACGDLQSTEYDYLLPCGLITNSLSLHYLAFHRSEIPGSEWEKLLRVWGAERNRPGDLTRDDVQLLREMVCVQKMPPCVPCGNQHVGIKCRVCSQQNFRGSRYVCIDCHVNYCGACYSGATHDSDHAVVHLRKPTSRFDTKKCVSVKRQRILSFNATAKRLPEG